MFNISTYAIERKRYFPRHSICSLVDNKFRVCKCVPNGKLAHRQPRTNMSNHLAHDLCGIRLNWNSFEIFRYSQNQRIIAANKLNSVIESGCVAITTRRWRYSILFAFEPRFFFYRCHYSSAKDRKFSMSIRVLVHSIRFHLILNLSEIGKHFLRLKMRFRSVSVMK